MRHHPLSSERPSLATRRAALFAGASIVVAACAPSAPSRPAEPPRPVVRTTPLPSSASTPTGPVAFSYAPGSYRFVVTTDAAIELSADSGSRSESRRTVAHMTYRIGPRATGMRVITGTVDSFTVSPVPTPGVSGALIPAPVAFRGSIDAARRIVDLRPAVPAPVASDCGTPTQALYGLVRETIVLPLPTLYAGQTWNDSTTSTVCRGDVPLTTRARHQYRVEGAVLYDGVEALHLTRATTLDLAGQGAQRGVSFTVGGRGTARTDLYLAPASGRLLGSSTESDLELDVSVPGRGAQRFRQRARQRVESATVEGRAGARRRQQPVGTTTKSAPAAPGRRP